MAFLTSATATATVAQNTNSVAISGMDLNQVQPGMVLYLGARDRVKGDGLIIAAVTPTGNSGGTIVLIGSVDAPYTNAAFLIDTIAYVGAAAVLQLEADYQVLNALRTFGGINTNLAGGNRQLWLDKKLTSSVSYLAFAVGGVLFGRMEQRTVTYTPTGGTTTTTEAITLRTSADGTILTDAIYVDTATGGVDALADSVTMVAASLTDLSSARKKKVTITGTVTITSFGPGKHLERLLTFQDAGLVLTHNATSLKLPGATNITTQAGDTCHATQDSSGNWHVRSYARADGTSLKTAAIALADISDASSAGRSLLAAANYPAMLGLLGTDALYTRKRNRFGNAGMRISLANGVSTVSPVGGGLYVVDGVKAELSSSGRISAQQIASNSPAGSPNRVRVTVTTAAGSLGSNDYCTLSIPIEGIEVADLKLGSTDARAFVVRKGVRLPAGTYAVAARNGAFSRCFAKLFTITGPQANTDQIITVPIPGDVAGTWARDNTVGLVLTLVLAAGSGLQTAGEAWATGGGVSSAGQSNFLASTSNVCEFFDVGVYEGSVAPPFELASQDDDARRCRRYWRFLPACSGNWWESDGTKFAATADFSTEPMRVPPAASLISGSGAIQRPGSAVVNVTGATVGFASTTAAQITLATPAQTAGLVGSFAGGGAVGLDSRM
ncbi:hypothetical protein HCU64_06460 [Methylobacterium sp. C25]|uniref:hypothetical protein n=1 Tax=Methylobacterium sp. C25 TaxID=2721622 RepID=UPI001F21336A|nr:hypothetical protein [Methylobacterium sp. C25]MCE4223388.1 hypothetical protein [Methylobacterium sp. C25]